MRPIRSGQHRSAPTRRSRDWEGIQYVTCRLCRRRFRVIAWNHLVCIHGWDIKDPVRKYQELFKARLRECRDTKRMRRQGRRRYIRRIGRHWTRERVIGEIRARKAQGKPLFLAAVVNDGRQDITHAALKLFGTWDRTLAASGLQPERVRKLRHWTPQKVIAEIRKLGGFVPSHILSKRDGGLFQVAVKLFGSWRKAYEAAGVPYTPQLERGKWSPERILSAIRDRARRGIPLRTSDAADRELQSLATAAWKRFGGWRQAVKVAGCILPPERKPPPRLAPWSRDEILAELKRLRREGKPVGRRDLERVRRQGYVALDTAIVNLFGTLAQAKKDAGFWDWDRKSPRWTRGGVLDMIRERARTGASLRPKDVAREVGGAYGAAYRDFGSWKAARAAAGIPPEEYRHPVTWTRERIENAVRDLERQGYFLTHGYGLASGDQKALWSAIRRRYQEPPSVVVRRILNVVDSEAGK